VIISLDMARTEIMDRIHCHVAGIDWTTLKFGSWERRRAGGGPWFNQHDQERLDAADRQIIEQGLGSRILVHDRMSLGNVITASRLSTIVEAFKRQAGASRTFLIIDYLQLLPVPEGTFKGGELEGDKYRVRLIQDYLDKTRTRANPGGDPVLAISEARKPPKAKDGWGNEMSELMGSARLAYAPPMVFTYRPASDTDLVIYHNVIKKEVAPMRAAFDSQGIAPVVLTLAKGRDGTQRGSWGLEFDYRRSTFRPLAPRRGPVIPTAEDAEEGEPDAAVNPPAPAPAPALPPAGRRRRASSTAQATETTPRTNSSRGSRTRRA
jgi:replicative DNA helicase